MATINRNIEHLETILKELAEAVIVCDRNGRILLYNAAAERLFQNSGALSPGKSLYGICARAPIEHSLRLLQHHGTGRSRFKPEESDVRFVCATADEELLVYCRLSQIHSKNGQGAVFVFSFEDMTRQISEMGRQGHLLETMIRDLRAPITNLNAAAENLKNNPEMEPEMRGEFEDVIFRESAELTRRFETVVREAENITNSQWPLFDVHSADLIGCVIRGLKEDAGITVTMTGVPLWLHADSYSLMRVLECAVRFVHRSCRVSEIDIEALPGDRRVYIDLIWKGASIPQSALDSLLETSLPDALAGLTVAEVLARHDSEMWSRKHLRQGYSLLRIPVPDSSRQWKTAAGPLPERTQFYDFSLTGGTGELGEMRDRPLSSLQYVVFDTETTGLNPSAGDEIVAIAAVRIVNGRILSKERFERLVRPRNPIPDSSAFFLNITEDMVREAPSIEEVLPQFISFVDDAVLVTHNGTFDMNFLKRVAAESGAGLDNPILDTLLLSAVVDKERTNHTLESMGQWLGVEVAETHTAMGDCFVTARIFLRLVELLESCGITTLGEAVAASERVVEEKKRSS